MYDISIRLVAIAMDIKVLIKSKTDNEYIYKDELYECITQEHPNYSKASYRWAIYNLVHSGLITKIGKNQFIKGHKRKYAYEYVGATHKQIVHYFEKELPNITAVIYESTILNEWLNHQLARNIIFVEVDKFYSDIIFEKLKNNIQSNILIKPKTGEFSRYAENNTIIIQNLVTQAPTNKHSYEIKLEKLIVDFFSEPNLKMIYSESELTPMLETIFQQYVIEQKKMFAYAKRRKCDQKIKNYIKQNTNIKLLENK